jgi:hypothetical protein
MAVDATSLALFCVISVLAGMTWGSRMGFPGAMRWPDTALTWFVTVVAYVAPLAFVLPETSDPGFESNKLLVILFLTTVVLPGAYSLFPRVLDRVRARRI